VVAGAPRCIGPEKICADVTGKRMSVSTDVDVLVIGAGLAGLRCALTLAEAGVTVHVVEAQDRVGGRLWTEQIDGFLCDRGFQVLNPAYPAAKRWLDLSSLELQPFGRGLLVRAADGWRVLADPLHHPDLAKATLSSGLLSVREITAILRWLAPTVLAPQRTAREPDRPLAASLDAAGITGRLRRVMDRFLAGVLVESRGSSSARFTQLLMRSFVLGAPALPTQGMGAIPAQLAGRLPHVHLSCPADRITRRGSSVITDTAVGQFSSRAVVVATDSLAARRLTGVPTVAMKGLTTWWFSSAEPPDHRPFLAVDGRTGLDGGPPGPVWNAAVVTNAAPSYAPAGHHLVQATTLLDRPDGDANEQAVRRHLSSIYQRPTTNWKLVTHHRVPHALPASAPPLHLTSSARIAPGTYVCGDHRDTSSIQGALVSGHRVATALLVDRGTDRT